MAAFIEPVLDALLAILNARTPAACHALGLTPFVEFNDWWTGVIVNMPAVFVTASETQFDPRREVGRRQAHNFRVRVVCESTDPHALVRLSMQYARAVDNAIAASEPAYAGTYGTQAPLDWVNIPGVAVKQVWITSHKFDLLGSIKGIAGMIDIEVAIVAEEPQ